MSLSQPDKENAPKESLRESARIFCILFLVVFTLCFAVFASLFIKALIDYNVALNSDACAGMDPTIGLGQFFDAADLQALAKAAAIATYGETTVNETPALIENVKATILSKYTLHGTTYTYNMLPVFSDWKWIWLCVVFVFLIAVQIYVYIRIEKASYTEYFTIIVLLFMSLNIPSAILLICGRR